MKVKLMGKQYVDFVTEDGNEIKGVKLHVVSLNKEDEDNFKGYRVADIFTRLDVSRIPLESTIDLVYEQALGSNKARLVAVELVK